MPPSTKDELKDHPLTQLQSLSSSSAGVHIPGRKTARTIVELECLTGMEPGYPIFDDPSSSSFHLEQLGLAWTKSEIGANVHTELTSPRTPEQVDRAIGPDAQRCDRRSQRKLDFPGADVGNNPDRSAAVKWNGGGDCGGRQRPLNITVTPPHGNVSRSTSPTGQSLPPKPFRSRGASPVSGPLTRSTSATEFSDGDAAVHRRIAADMNAEHGSRHMRTNSAEFIEGARRRSNGVDYNPMDRGRLQGDACSSGVPGVASGNFMESLMGLAQTMVGSNLLQDADSALAVSKIMMGMSELALSFSKQAAAAQGGGSQSHVSSPVQQALAPESTLQGVASAAPSPLCAPSPQAPPASMPPITLGRSQAPPPLVFAQMPGLLAQALNSNSVASSPVGGAAVTGGGYQRKPRGYSLPCSPHLTPFGTPADTPAATPGNSPRSSNGASAGPAFANLGGPPLHSLDELQLEQRFGAAKRAAESARWKVKYVGKMRRMPPEYYLLKALQEQMAAGDCTKPQPMFDASGSLDHEGREVWRAWKELAGLSAGDARKKYISTVEDLDVSALRPSPRRSFSSDLLAAQGVSPVAAVGTAAAAAVRATAAAQAAGQRGGGMDLPPQNAALGYNQHGANSAIQVTG